MSDAATEAQAWHVRQDAPGRAPARSVRELAPSTLPVVNNGAGEPAYVVTWQTVAAPPEAPVRREAFAVCTLPGCGHLAARTYRGTVLVRDRDAKDGGREATPPACRDLACDCCEGHDAAEVDWQSDRSGRPDGTPYGARRRMPT